jgi:TolA-binding protein
VAEEKKEEKTGATAPEQADTAPVQADSAPQDQKEEKISKKKRITETYSVPMYVTVMFAVFIVLILLSYFISQRNSNQVITDLNTEHSKVQSQALENIEELQDTNLALTEQVGEYEERMSQLEEEVAQLQQQLTENQEDLEKLETTQKNLSDTQAKYSALHALFEYVQALENGSDAEITAKATKIEAQKSALDEETRAYYDQLVGAQ